MATTSLRWTWLDPIDGAPSRQTTTGTFGGRLGNRRVQRARDCLANRFNPFLDLA